MRIRLSFAKALLNDASVLLFDEPTASLDPQSSHLIRDIIRDLKREGHAIILTTHNMEEADLLSDRVAIIDQGKLALLGPPSELKQKVKSSDVIEIEARNLAEQTANALQSFSEVSNVAKTGSIQPAETEVLRVHVEKGKEVLPRILEFLVRKQVTITKVTFIEPTLEDVFVELTGLSTDVMKAEKEQGKKAANLG
jgi:ABC-2 type transport system ATP-binding protein